MDTFSRITGMVFGLAIVILGSCIPVAPAPTATAKAQPTQDATPLSSRVSLTTVSMREEGASPKYIITGQIPRLAGSEDERVADFNNKAEKMMQKEIQYFRENVLAHMTSTPITSGSSFDAQYALVYQNNGIWALKFIFSGYTDGAAHPFHYSLTLNYDLEQGKALSLENLFVAESGYLTTISSFCIAELSRRDIGFYGGFEQGAEPMEENYRNWNITRDGILITFDEYQVAPYAAGPQTVVVPYSELHSLINSNGPLALVAR